MGFQLSCLLTQTDHHLGTEQKASSQALAEQYSASKEITAPGLLLILTPLRTK